MTPPPLPPEVNAIIVRPHRANLILLLGVMGFVFAPFGLFAILLSKRDLRDMALGTMDKTGEPLTRIGRMMAVIASIVWAIKWLILCILGAIVYFNWDYFQKWF